MENSESIKSDALRLGSGQHKVNCPFCTHLRKKKHIKTLSLKVEEKSIFFNCWHCSKDGVIKIKQDNFKFIRREPLSQTIEKKWNDIDNNVVTYLKSRGISKDTAIKSGLKHTKQFISGTNKEENCIVFPYFNKGKMEYAKLRSFPQKGFSSHGSALNFYNIDSVEEKDWVIICEGEIDCLSFKEIGLNQVVSIPHGAVMKVTDGKIDPQEDTKFRFIWNAKSKLDKCNKIILALDNDKSGQAMAEEIARRVGKDKCWKIEYPDGCKDANEVLVKFGVEKLDEIATRPIPYPVSGLYDAEHFYEEVDDIYDKGVGTGISTGYKDVDDIYTVVEGQLSVVTGHPSSGKSEFIDQIMVNIAKEKNWKFGICSFENEPRIHISKLISKYLEKPFFGDVSKRMSKEELKEGKEFVQKHFSFLYQADGSLSSLDSIITRMKIAVMRHGVRGIIIDPYNYIARDQDTSETDWISEMLTKLRVFAQAHSIHIWFVAHPTKMMRRDDGTVPPPKGYDISGSASWFAKADVGLTVHRPNPSYSDISEILVWKCRFSWVGAIGQCSLLFNKLTTTYSSTSEYYERDKFLAPRPIEGSVETEEPDKDEIPF